MIQILKDENVENMNAMIHIIRLCADGTAVHIVDNLQ